MRRIFFALIVEIVIFAYPVEAAKIDLYRDAIINKNFTLKYEIKTAPVYNSMKEGSLTFHGDLLNKVQQKSADRPYKGIIVVSGADRYTEINHDAYETTLGNISNLTLADRYNLKADFQNSKIKVPESGSCILLKNEELFQFIWSKDDNKRKYKGKVKWWEFKSGEVKANIDISRTPYQDLLEEFNYGMPEVASILLPMLPKEKVIATSWTPDYKFLDSGSLANGLTYEDYVSDKDNLYSAIRYYFNGNNLVKVAVANYLKNDGQIQSYEKKVINITEFSTSADVSYLKLPESLKDTTQRDKEISK